MPFKFDNIKNAYSTIMHIADKPIGQLFKVAGNMFDPLQEPVEAAAAVYVALLGYTLLTGKVTMSMHEAFVRISKVVLVIIVFGFYTTNMDKFYQGFWDIVIGVTSKFIDVVTSGSVTGILGNDGVGGFYARTPDMDALVNGYQQSLMKLMKIAVDGKIITDTADFIFIALFMAPVLVGTLIVIVAKFITLLLVVVAPFIAFMMLIGYSNNYLSAWIKQLLVTGLTVIITYMIFAVVILMLSTLTADIINKSGNNLSVPELFPLAIMSVIGFVLIGQGPSLASNLLGAAGIQTGQISSLVQLGLMRTAVK